MKRRDFNKHILILGMGAQAGCANANFVSDEAQSGNFYEEPAKKLPIRKFDVVVAGAGTGGVVAALAAAKQGAKTMLIERKGYTGGTVTEGGTALHSFYNLWKAFPGGVRGDRLGVPAAGGGTMEKDRQGQGVELREFRAGSGWPGTDDS